MAEGKWEYVRLSGEKGNKGDKGDTGASVNRNLLRTKAVNGGLSFGFNTEKGYYKWNIGAPNNDNYMNLKWDEGAADILTVGKTYTFSCFVEDPADWLTSVRAEGWSFGLFNRSACKIELHKGWCGVTFVMTQDYYSEAFTNNRVLVDDTSAGRPTTAPATDIIVKDWKFEEGDTRTAWCLAVSETVGDKGDQGVSNITINTTYTGTKANLDSWASSSSDNWNFTYFKSDYSKVKVGDLVWFVCTCNDTTSPYYNKKASVPRTVSAISSSKFTTSSAGLSTQWEALDGATGAPAKLWTFNASHSTYPRDLRSSDSFDIDLEAEISGYDYTPSWTTSEGKLTDITGGKRLSIPRNNPYDSVTVTMSYGSSDETTYSLTFSVVDITEYDRFYEMIANPASISGVVLNGDYFVCSETNDDYYVKGNVYYYDGNIKWPLLDATSASAADKMLNALTCLTNSDIDFSTINNPNVISWFNTIVANKAVIKNLFSQNITIEGDGVIQSDEYEEDENGFPVKGYILTAKGVGKYYGLKTKDMTATNAKIIGENASFYSDTFATSKNSDVEVSVVRNTSNLVECYSTSAFCETVKNYAFGNSLSYKKQLIDAGVHYLLETYGLPNTAEVANGDVFCIYNNISGDIAGKHFTECWLPYSVSRSFTAYWDYIYVNNIALVIFQNDTGKYTENGHTDPVSNRSLATYNGVTIADSASHYLGGLMTSEFISGLNIPLGFSTPITEGTAIVGASEYGEGDLVTLDANSIQIGSSTMRVGEFVTFNLAFTVAASKAGIKTMNIVTMDDGEYSIGTSTRRFKEIYGDKVYGAVFN